jgi:FAD/FMN-containing dehydrogenase
VVNRGLTRRQVLGGTLAAGVGALAAGCGRHTPSAAPSTPTSAAPTPASSATRTAAPDWTALRSQLHGSLARPGDGGYDTSRLLFNRRFDPTSTPDAIAAVASEADVVACVRFARDAGIPIRIRAGGHSYLGASTGSGLVVDVRALKGVAAGGSAGAATATVGAGAQLIDVYSELAARGVLIPAGSCPSVGLSGLALGGGMGVVGRKYGLTCDRLESARVVLADGRAVTASATSEPDLFWALRGGGGNFGVVTSMTLRTYPAQTLALFSLSWPWDDAAEVLAGWQQWVTGTPDELWSTCHLLATADGTAGPTASVSGVYVGDVAAMQGLLSGLQSAVGHAPSSTYTSQKSALDAMLIEAGCASTPVTSCQIADFGGGSLSRDAFVAGSDYFSAPIPRAAIDAVASAVEARQTDPALGVGGVAFDSWGGAVNAVAPADTAFVHRRSNFAAQYTASWQTQPGDGPQAANQTSLRTLQAALHPAANGEAYQNYADSALSDPLAAYYGANLTRLRGVKKSYDPDNFFIQPQGITPG